MTFRIESIHAFISIAPDGDEGVMAFRAGDQWVPMIGADAARIDELRPIADHLSEQSGVPYKLVFFRRIDDQ